jgi:hypothetical protein
MQLKLDLPKADKNQFGSRLAYLESFTEAGIASENFVYDHYNKSVCKSQVTFKKEKKRSDRTRSLRHILK